MEAFYNFSENIPQEKVYLHFDNTGYYQGDNIWFKCYVVTSGQHQLSQRSKTLYVELLNPGGEMVDKRILPIENGQCHGDFSLNQLPFYSGFYEVRAYTKYMLNFGDDVIFSRLLPVFNKPKAEGNFEEKEMLRYGRWGTANYPMKREQPIKGKTVNLRFFPEGGNLIQGVASRLAFEATDEAGNPVNITGVVMDGNKQELCRITCLHEGRGVFTYTPGAGKRKDTAEVEYSGKKYRFDLPAGLPQGVVMEVDNLSYPDSMGITLRKNGNTPDNILGVVVLNGGKLQNDCYVWIRKDEVGFKLDKTQLFSGVSQIILFNSSGEILCDRLIFTDKKENRLNITAKTNKPVYNPHEWIDMEISVADKSADPVDATFSLSIRDAANEVESKHNILTDLLLISEIKGYVRNPSYYFEEDDDTRSAALDLLLMVQGWRRYSWKQMAGVENFELKYLPEQGIETRGRIVSLARQKPQPNVDVSLLLYELGTEEEQGSGAVAYFVTDEQGRFSFVSGISGKWDMLLSVTEKGKKKDHRILLDRVFSPEPKRYRYADLQLSIAEEKNENIPDEETSDPLEDDFESFPVAYSDSLTQSGITGKTHQLPEVTVKAKKRTREQDIFHNRSTSVAYYDVASEYDDIYDRGEYIGGDLHELLKNTNEDFEIINRGTHEFLHYKGKMVVFVVDYKQTGWNELGYFSYQHIRLPAIKSIYINEKASVIAQYIDSPYSMEIAMGLSCAVFIETYPEGQIPADSAKGVRKTRLEGYSAVKEFYSPDYSLLAPEPDYRRTLYWNPAVTTDGSGNAKIGFYNNSSCKNFSISAETVTPQGMIGIYKH